MIELFPKIINGWNLLTIFTKSFILDIWQGSEYTSEYCKRAEQLVERDQSEQMTANE